MKLSSWTDYKFGVMFFKNNNQILNRILIAIKNSSTLKFILFYLYSSIQDNGTYFCQAENKAARTVSNFTLHVTDSVDSPTILQVQNDDI